MMNATTMAGRASLPVGEGGGPEPGLWGDRHPPIDAWTVSGDLLVTIWLLDASLVAFMQRRVNAV
jgi:hypothetical protein